MHEYVSIYYMHHNDIGCPGYRLQPMHGRAQRVGVQDLGEHHRLASRRVQHVDRHAVAAELLQLGQLSCFRLALLLSTNVGRGQLDPGLLSRFLLTLDALLRSSEGSVQLGDTPSLGVSVARQSGHLVSQSVTLGFELLAGGRKLVQLGLCLDKTLLHLCASKGSSSGDFLGQS